MNILLLTFNLSSDIIVVIMSDNQTNHKETSPRDLEGKTSYPKNKIKILLLENIHPVAVKILTDHEFQV